MSRLRPVLVFPDPWQAEDILNAHPDLPVATGGDEATAQRFAARGARAIVVPGARSPEDLLADPGVRKLLGRPSYVVAPETSARLERAAAASRSRPAFASAARVRALLNRRRLPEIAALAKVEAAPQRVGTIRPGTPREELGLGDDLVVQGPRGERPRRARTPEDWTDALRAARGPVRVATYIEGRPATVLAVIDSAGRGVLSPPLATLRGHPTLTDDPMRTCADDFTRRAPDADLASVVEALGRPLARAGFRGAARFDFVVRDDGDAVVVGFDPCVDPTFCLWIAHRPDVLTLLLRALDGHALPSRRHVPHPVGLATEHPGGAGPSPAGQRRSALAHDPHEARIRVQGPLIDAQGDCVAG